MPGRRLLIHTFFLFLLPLVVAGFGISLAGAAGLVLLALLWRWVISLSIFLVPPKIPELELETISASHFVEKVRWCLDRLGVDYLERPAAGTLGAFFLGRTVPVLKFRTGAVRSSIGNSPEILRYLWGRYSVEMPDQALFLEPGKDRLELETQIDRCGVSLQVWVYFHILDERELSLHAWGANNPAIPAWQRLSLKLLFPLLRFLIRKSFRITKENHEKSVSRITGLLSDVEIKLSDNRKSILGGDSLNFTDFGFAAIMGLWVQPEGFGGGRADAVRIDLDLCPVGMIEEIESWSSSFPLSTAFIEELYRNERKTSG